MPLTLLRHTQPDVEPGVCYGRTDLDVTDDFSRQAAMAAQTLGENLPPVDVILSSPAQRCRKLAEYICTQHQIVLVEEPRLLEIDFGRWERQRWDAIPRRELDVWANDLLHANPYKGETVAQLRARVADLLQAFPFTHQHVLWVTHAGVIKAAANLQQGDSEPGNFDWSMTVGFGESVTFSAG